MDDNPYRAPQIQPEPQKPRRLSRIQRIIFSIMFVFTSLGAWSCAHAIRSVDHPDKEPIKHFLLMVANVIFAIAFSGAVIMSFLPQKKP